MKHLIKITLISIACVSIHYANAQSSLIHFSPDTVTRFDFRFMHPNIKGVDDQGILSGTYDLAFAMPINNKWTLSASLPYGVAKYERKVYTFDPTLYNVFKANEKGIGNLQINVFHQLSQNNGQFRLNAGLCLPTASNDKQIALEHMSLSDIYNIQKYISETTTLMLGFNYIKQPQTGWYGYRELGLKYLIYNSEYADNDVFASFQFGCGYRGSEIAGYAEFKGLLRLSEWQVEDLINNFFPKLNLGMQLRGERFQPGIFYGLYLTDNLSDTIKGTMGIKIAYRLKN